MRLLNLTTVSFNIAMRAFAPTQSGKLGYFQADGDVEIFALDRCDKCGAECRGANPITLVKPSPFVLAALKQREASGKLGQSDALDELGCNEAGEGVCPSCYGKQEAGG